LFKFFLCVSRFVAFILCRPSKNGSVSYSALCCRSALISRFGLSYECDCNVLIAKSNEQWPLCIGQVVDARVFVIKFAFISLVNLFFSSSLFSISICFLTVRVCVSMFSSCYYIVSFSQCLI